MVFHKWKTIFVGIAKNASMSMFHTLINPSDNQCTSHNHNSIVEDLNEGDESLLNTYFSFAISRNPYERFFSAWKHNNPHPGPIDVKDYINNFNLWVKDFSGQDRMIDLKKHHHFKPQNKYITIHNTIVVDKILRFEDLENDFNHMVSEWKLSNRLSFKYNLSVKYENKGVDTVTLDEILNNESKNIIQDYYYRDFEFFKYKP